MSSIKPKKCKVCKEVFSPKNTLQYVCGVKCAVRYIEVKKDKEWKAKKKILKEKLKTISDYKKEARYWFQRWVRIRDLGKSCISCNAHLKDIRNYDAGHYYSASGYPQLLFNEQNVNGQCVHCNNHKSGNIIEYRKGLIKRYGLEILEQLDTLSENKKTRIYTKEYCISIIKKYKDDIENS